MKTISYLLVLFITMLTTQTTKSQDSKLENSMLWKIDHKNHKKSSFLMGTIHVICKEDFKIKDKISKALAATDQLVMEVNITDPNEFKSLQQGALGKQKLSEQLTEIQLAKLSTFLKDKMGMTLAQVDNYTLSTIYSLSILQNLPCTEKKMYEFELSALAKQQGKPIKGLETVNEQLGYFEKAYPTDFLLQQLDLFDEYEKMFPLLVTAYNKENLEELFAQITNEKYMDPNNKKWLLEYRNKNWAKKIPLMLEEGSNFFAVGSAHLVGENGVIQLLRKKGYIVTPVLN